jgi:eukaryotic-like serine/threonine-protein kinase
MTYPLESELFTAIAWVGLACMLLAGWYCDWKAPALAALERVLAPVTARGPRRIGPYLLGDRLGAGGMGEVYRARHSRWGRPCAIKVLPRNAPERDRNRFETEAQITARLRHPNTVSVHDYGRAPDGTSYYVMELLDGVTLERLVEQHGAQAPARVIPILRQLCAALTEAHGRGLVHRDIKPANVLLCGEGSDEPGRVKLLDFGLVTQIPNADHPSQSTNAVVGTPLYMSPEAIRAPETVGVRSDLYGLGAVAYFLLTGAPVFNGATVIEVCSQHLHSEPRPLMLAAPYVVSRELESLVLDCLAKDPARRPTSAAELAARLARCPDAAIWSPVEPLAQTEEVEGRASGAILIEGRFPGLPCARLERRACA